ncbi:MAG: sugar transferase [Firmicutes bacterium]|nr:sugar transferase [Bacillota bacterium]
MRRTSKPLTFLIAFGDILSVNAAFFGTFWLKFGGDIPGENLQPFLNLIPWISLAALGSLWLFDLYGWPLKRFREILNGIIWGSVVTSLATTVLAFVSYGFAFPRTVLFGSVITQIIVLSTWRFSLVFFKRRLQEKKNIIIVGLNGDAEEIAAKFLAYHGRDYVVQAVYEAKDIYLVIQKISETAAVCFGSKVPNDIKETAIIRCIEEGKEVFLLPELYEILLQNAKLSQIGDLPLFQIEGLPLSGAEAPGKRFLDLVLALTGSVVLVLLTPIIGLAIFLSSPGPIFYVQNRVGQNGKIFGLIKFRTMVDHAEKKTGPVLAGKKDPRITVVGRILRATRLDELPQLVNVIKGEMSFVGPRPERPFFVEQFAEEIPEYKHRLKLKPGITGLAQVLGNYNTTPRDKLRYDLMYIRNYSLLLDLQIVFQTLRVVLMPEKARGVSGTSEEILRQISALKHHNAGAVPARR